MDYREIIQGDNFQRLAALLRVADRPEWQAKHPASEFGFYLSKFAEAAGQDSPASQQIVEAYASMTSSALQADPRLSIYINHDVWLWLMAVIHEDCAHTILMMLLAVASCEGAMLTPQEIATISDFSESHWRNRAAAGSIPGAVKKGKQWLIPATWLRY